MLFFLIVKMDKNCIHGIDDKPLHAVARYQGAFVQQSNLKYLVNYYRFLSACETAPLFVIK